MCEKMAVNDTAYSVIKLLGKGKGGYSYLATDGFVVRGLAPTAAGQIVRPTSCPQAMR